MITYIKIHGFKSFHNFEMEFTVEMLVNRKVKDNWGGEVDVKYTRLRYQLRIKREFNTIGFESLSIVKEYLENFKHNEDDWIKNYIPKPVLESWRPKVVTGRRGIPYIFTEDRDGIATIVVPQDGTQGNKKNFPAKNASQTVLSSINTIEFKHILAAKEEMLSWKFMQLNPEDLRQPTRQDIGIRDTITASGKNLAAALFRIKQEDEYTLTEISRTLNNLLPNLIEVNVYNDKANQQYIIKVKGEDGREFSSRVLSEGTLRLLALCVLEYDPQHTGLLCFEEPENGIHPFRIEAMARLLKDLSVDFEETEMPLRQVIVNTHSPVLVSQLIDWKDDKNVSIWFSRLNTLTTTIDTRRMTSYIHRLDKKST